MSGWKFLSNTTTATPLVEDRISSLEDKILCHILSFVPIKQAIATVFLSKRWTNLWRFIPVLDFNYTKLEDLNSCSSFKNFVSDVLIFRDYDSIINSFFLDIEYVNPDLVYSLTIPGDILITWVRFVVERRVKYLHLLLNLIDNDDENKIPRLPLDIFNCKTLVVLKLRSFIVKVFFFNSDEFVFPSLKTLHLQNFYFNKDRDVILLLAKCPILEDFKACYVFVSKKVYDLYDFPTFHNLTHLVLNYDDWGMVVKVLHHCPKLQNLELYQKIQTKWDVPRLSSYLRACTIQEFVPQCLSSYLNTCTIRDFAFTNLRHHIILAEYILKNARVLHIMTIWCDKEQHEIETRLSLCSKASATCQLSVIENI